nr:MAG TPA: hypothetical protein [Caudoviricetes sp.]
MDAMKNLLSGMVYSIMRGEGMASQGGVVVRTPLQRR